MMPKAKHKESHKPVNPDRRYEVDEIASNSSEKPSRVIPEEYWEDFRRRTESPEAPF